MDLLDFFRGKHSWAKLLRLLDQLPRASKFREAQADDDELAEQVAGDKPGAAARPTVPLSAFTPEYELLTAVVEMLMSLNSNVIRLGSGKPPRIRPLPRPVTAFDRARERKRTQRVESLIAEVQEAQQRWVDRRSDTSREEHASG